MRKLLVSMLFALLLVGFAPVVSAEEVDVDKVNQIVDNANAKIEDEIAKAKTEADLIVAMYADDEEAMNFHLDRIINQLLEKTYMISAKAIVKGEREGVELICDYVPVEIGDREVLVDPIRVHIW